ncbi:MAG: peptidogalycan biosysnthesis protein, partial [Rubrivivax sp.]
YLKSHSQGEYVFDHGWADALERAGGEYYPKVQVCVPFSPVPGPRLLVRDDQGHLAGIVSFDDLLDACAQQLSGLADVMRKGLQREATERAMASTPQTLTLQIPALGTAAWQVSAAA